MLFLIHNIMQEVYRFEVSVAGLEHSICEDCFYWFESSLGKSRVLGNEALFSNSFIQVDTRLFIKLVQMLKGTTLNGSVVENVAYSQLFSEQSLTLTTKRGVPILSQGLKNVGRREERLRLLERLVVSGMDENQQKEFMERSRMIREFDRHEYLLSKEVVLQRAVFFQNEYFDGILQKIGEWAGEIEIAVDGRWSSPRKGKESTLSVILIRGPEEYERRVILVVNLIWRRNKSTFSSDTVYFEHRGLKIYKENEYLYSVDKCVSVLLESIGLRIAMLILRKRNIKIWRIVKDQDNKSGEILKEFGLEDRAFYDLNHSIKSTKKGLEKLYRKNRTTFLGDNEKWGNPERRSRLFSKITSHIRFCVNATKDSATSPDSILNVIHHFSNEHSSFML